MDVFLPPPYDFASLTEKRAYTSPEEVVDCQPAVLVDVALSRLQAAGVKPIEWRALLYRRMTVPLVIKHFSYVVPDEDIIRASDILSEMGLPPTPHSILFTRVEGDIHTKATHHRLTRESAPALVQYLALYPFVSLDPEELYTTPSIHFTIPATSTSVEILVPRPSAVYAWLLRTMCRYPRWCSVWTKFSSDLSQLVDYHLLHVEEGYVNPDECPELWKALNMEKRIADALEVINEWTRNREWREGEESFGDALAAIVSWNTEIDDLPPDS